MPITKYLDAPEKTFQERFNVFESGKPGKDEVCVGYVRSQRSLQPQRRSRYDRS